MLRMVWTLRLLPALVAGALLGGTAHKLSAQARPQTQGCYNTCGTEFCPYYSYWVVATPPGQVGNSRLPITGGMCQAGVCDNCVAALASRALVPEMLAAVRAGDIDRLARAVVSNTPRVVLNVARQAIQITGCSDQQLVASIPVRPFVFAALQRSMASHTADLAAAFTDDGSALALLRGRRPW